MPLYVIEIPGSEFTGSRGGVDFFQGKGTTSSTVDARRLASLGYQVSETTSKTQAEGAAAAAPSALTPSPEEKAAEVAQEAAARAQDLLERDPDSAWSRRRAELAAKAKKRPAGRRHR